MAFFSNSGEKIYSGAAGLGHHNYGKLASFRDGSLGVMATMISGAKKQPWHSNAIYEDEQEEYIIVPPPRANRTRPLRTSYNQRRFSSNSVRGTNMMAYQDGVLGAYGGTLQSFQDGSLGGYGLLQAYEDGSLGADNERDIAASGEYYTATGEYFTGTAGCGSCRGLGQAASGPVLNLSDPATLLEVKALIAYSPLMSPNVGNPATQADINDPKWTAYTTSLVDQLLQLNAMQATAQFEATAADQRPKNADGSVMTLDQFQSDLVAQLGAAFPPPERYPSYDGIMLLRAMLGTAPINVPNVDAFIQAAGNTGGVVLPPNQSRQANMMAIGAGVAVVALLGALFFTGKKRS